MPHDSPDIPPQSSGRRFRWLLVAAILGAVVVALSIVIVVLLAHDTEPATLHSWADAGQAFGAVSAIVSTAALIALIVTFAAQQHELKGQRQELRLQAESLASSRQELRCTAETGLAMHHLRLLEITFHHPELGVVWPSWSTDLPVEVNQRHLYCTTILDGIWLNQRTGRFEDRDVQAAVAYMFTNEVFREHWQITRDKRMQAAAADGPEARFFRTIDEQYPDQASSN